MFYQRSETKDRTVTDWKVPEELKDTYQHIRTNRFRRQTLKLNNTIEKKYSFEEFLKRAEEKRVDLVIAEKFFEQKMLEGAIILKPNKMYQNIP